MSFIKVGARILVVAFFCWIFIMTHECGHYACARACGISVESVQIGTGTMWLKIVLPDGVPLSFHAYPFAGMVRLNTDDIIAAYYDAPPLKLLALSFAGMFSTASVAFLLLAAFAWVTGLTTGLWRALAYGGIKAFVGFVTLPFRLLWSVLTCRALKALENSHSFALLMAFIGNSKLKYVTAERSEIATVSGPLLWLGAAAATCQFITWFVLLFVTSDRSDSWKTVEGIVSCFTHSGSVAAVIAANLWSIISIGIMLTFLIQIVAQMIFEKRNKV